MGKIRVKTFGEEGDEQEKKLKARREQKKIAKAPGMKGGERTVMVGPSEEEVLAQASAEETLETAVDGEGKKAKKEKFKVKKILGKRYIANSARVQKGSSYPLDRAVETLKKFQGAKFDETVELHVNVKEKGISGQVALPHGTGKKLRIKIADDAIIADVEKGKIDFDVLVAIPAMMPKLAKVARVLGPRGLMPNPKNGTISQNPEEVVEKLSKGQIHYKTEPEAPIIHMSIGKASFEEKQIKDNISAVLKSIGATKINSVTLKSTMSPGIHLDISAFVKA